MWGRCLRGPHLQVGVLGSGTYGLVIQAQDTSDPEGGSVAIKLLPRGGFVSGIAASAAHAFRAHQMRSALSASDANALSAQRIQRLPGLVATAAGPGHNAQV